MKMILLITSFSQFRFGLVIVLFGSKDHVALDRNPGPGCDTLLLLMIPGDLFSACPLHSLDINEVQYTAIKNFQA